MTPVSFSIPGDARGKGRPRATIRGHHAAVYTDAKTASYENLVRLSAAGAMIGRTPISEPVSMVIEVRVTPPKSASRKLTASMLLGAVRPAKKPDLTNIMKAVEDGCNGVVYADDSQIVHIVGSKRYDTTPGVDVKVMCLEPQG